VPDTSDRASPRLSPKFDKSPDLFPIRRHHVDLASCAIGGMYAPAAEAERRLVTMHSERGVLLTAEYRGVLSGFRHNVARMLDVPAEEVAYVPNTAAGLSMLANGYPFESGDQVIGYEHEFPSNHFPWILQRDRGVEVVLLSDVDGGSGIPPGRPRAWSLGELADRITERTRVVALSHVQFSSGYAADLTALGALCRDRGIDLIVDAAQSLGVLSLRPRQLGISAVVASAWKWLLGPRGAGLAWVGSDLAAKLRPTMAGDGMMKHRLDYLNRTWEPVEGARVLEYSTLPWEHLVAIETVVEEVFLRYGVEAIRDEVFRLQDILVARLDPEHARPAGFGAAHRSGILSLVTRRDPTELVDALRAEDIVATAQGAYLRIAPHFYLEDADMERVADALARLA
jgi:selenocysteine lyase/cysteine desulfurase